METFHGPSVPLLTGFDCTKSDVLAVMQNNHFGKYKNYWVTVQSQKALVKCMFCSYGQQKLVFGDST